MYTRRVGHGYVANFVVSVTTLFCEEGLLDDMLFVSPSGGKFSSGATSGVGSKLLLLLLNLASMLLRMDLLNLMVWPPTCLAVSCKVVNTSATRAPAITLETTPIKKQIQYY